MELPFRLVLGYNHNKFNKVTYTRLGIGLGLKGMQTQKQYYWSPSLKGCVESFLTNNLNQEATNHFSINFTYVVNSFGDMKDDMGRLGSIQNQLFKHVGTISLKERKLRFKTWMQIKS
jgi:hypothetical protein